ncbi:phage tail tape measure protein [Mycobacterium celatum]|uniref:Phage tail tape measure protein n=1 Tax=Mycobacterium celatum TaxID=28045 RepID=A0A2G5PQL8_MYCCE|nr:phage tail tape measure protein [Mycobacterium celatum]PIB80566.1 phage tail tape measure protein [Mycobacterium celatum]
MPVFLDVKSRLDVAAAQLAAREAKAIFTKAGDDIGRGLGGSLSKALSVIDGSAARASLRGLQDEYRATAAAEEAAAAKMMRSMGQVEVAQKRLSEITAKYGADSSKAAAANVALADSHARAAKAQRDHADAMVATEGAAAKLSTTSRAASDTVSRAGQVFNAVGVASVAGLGFAMVDTTKKAADFQQAMTKLHASAGLPAQDLKTASDGILKLAGQVGYSAGELSEGMYTITKAGYSAADGLKVLQAAAQGANAEQAPLPEVVNALTTSLQDFHVPADQAAKVMSQMVTAVGESKVPLQEFAGALHTIEPTAAQLHLSLADVWGTLAQITQSGTSADQAADQINNAMRALSGAQAPARQAMQQWGIDADDVSQKLGGPNGRGLAGTMQYLYNTLAQKVDPSTKLLNTGDVLKSAQAVNDMNEMLTKMSPAARQAAEALHNHTIAHREYQMVVRKSNEQDATQLKQYQALDDKVEGFSKRLTGGRQTLETLNQALNEVTGTMSGAAVALQTTGAHTDEVNGKIKAIAETTQEADGTVKGFHESQETLNAKMRDAKAAFSAAAIEMGNVFVPVATDVANIAKTIGDTMAQHPAIMHAVIDALGALGGAWLAIKAANIVSSILQPIVGALGTMVAEEDAATAAAGRLGGALSNLGKFGALGIGAQLGGNALQHATEGNSFLHGAAVVGTDAATGAATGAMIASVVPGIGTGVGGVVGGLVGGGIGLYHQLAGHAGGGPLRASGPKGKDSALFWGADGEHVLTADDVDAMGGHSAVYAFRDALHRQYGGAIGPDVAAAASMVGTPYSQASRHDCSGMVARVICRTLGLPESSLPSTVNMGQWLASLGFRPGIGGPGAISVGWYDHGGGNAGHAAMTLSDGENAESGGSHGNFLVGGGAAGATSSQFDHHMFLPIGNLQGPAGYGGGGFGGYGGGGFGGGIGGFGGSGGVPAGSTPGVGPSGEPGYYTPSPAKVDAANNRYLKAQERLTEAKEREAEVSQKTNAKQSERDRAHNQVTDAERELAAAQRNLAKAQQGTFHRMSSRSGGAGGLGGLQFGAPLAEGFGLSGGIKGLGEWIVTFLADLAIGPIEGAMLGNALRSGDSGFGAPGGYADLGDYGTPLPTAAAAGGGAAPATPAAYTGGDFSGSSAPTAASSADQSTAPASTPSAAPHESVNYKDWYPNTAPPPAGDWLLPPVGGRPGIQGRSGANPPPPFSYKDWYPGSPDIGHNPPPVHFRGLNGPQDGGFADFVRQHPELANRRPTYNTLPGQPIFTPPIAPPQGRPPDPGLGSLLGAPGFATGGPVGTDTIPAWLTPGEHVFDADDVRAMGGQDAVYAFRNALHRNHGGAVYLVGGGDPTQPPPPTPKPPAAPQQKPGAQPHLPVGAPKSPGPGNKGTEPTEVSPEDVSARTPEGVAKPGASQRLPGQDLPPSPGLGFGGGIIGAAESAAASAGSMFPGGSAAGAGMQVAFQDLNRTAGYLGQLGGIAAEGVLGTLIPADSPLSDWGNTLPGKILKGISGVRPAQPNSAGQTQPPLAPTGGDDVHNGDRIGSQLNLHGPVTVQANNADEFHQSLAAGLSSAQRQNPAPMRVPR